VPLFAYATVVQYNDPDPVRWMAVYASAGILCAVAAFRHVPSALPAAVALIALAWALVWLPDVVHEGAFTFDEIQRELGGLLIVVGCMTALFRASRRS